MALRVAIFACLAALAAPLPSMAIDRDSVMTTAASYATHRWTCTDANTRASCSRTYQSDYAPGTYTGVPYDWGGFKTLAQFDDELDRGYGAGSHSRHGILSCTTGVDCSGYVSKCWGASHHTTSSMDQISSVISKTSVKNGDIFNKAGSHVVLFSHVAQSGEPVFYEASGSASKVRLNATGGWSALNGYTARRYNQIEDGTPATCPTPTEINGFPFHVNANTATSPCDRFDAYSCAPSTREGGPEIAYVFTVSEAGTFTASVASGPGVDIDLHLLSALDAGACLTRGHTRVEQHIAAGEYFLLADTYIGASGTEYAGVFDLDADFVPDGGPQPTDDVWGVVYEDRGDGDTSTRLTGATVTVLQTGASATAAGEYAVWSFDLQPGTYTFRASRAGYADNERTCEVIAGATNWCSIGLTPVTDGTLTGVAFEDRGDGDMSIRLTGAAITVLETGAFAAAEGEDALWAFALPPGRYTVRASMPGHADAERSCEVTAGGTTWCSVGLAPRTSGEAKGVVYDDPGNGDMSARLPGATVTVVETDETTAARGGDAIWSFELAPGTYTLRASMPGYGDSEVACEVAADATAWCSIGLTRLGGTEIVQGVVYRDIGGSDMSVRLPGAEVRLLETGAEAVAQGEGASWSFALAPGTYTLEASMPGYDTGQRECAVIAGDDNWCSIGLTRQGGGGGEFAEYLHRAASVVLSEDTDLGYGSGHTTRDLYYSGEKVWSVTNRTSHCVGITFQILLMAMNLYYDETGDASVWSMPASYMKWEPFKHCWYVDHQIGCLGGADALVKYGLGEKVGAYSELQPGDFLNYDRTNGTGHSVMFLGYLHDDGSVRPEYSASVVGFRYVSSQGTTNGVGAKNAFFDGECDTGFPDRDCGIIRSSLVMGRVWQPADFVPQSPPPLPAAVALPRPVDLRYFDDRGAAWLE